MTVEQLIKELQDADPKMQVCIGGAKHNTPGKSIGGVWHGSNYIEIFPG